MSSGKIFEAGRSSHQADASPARDPIAIIGIGCRYPGASGPEELWRNLLAGEEAVAPYREERFPELDQMYANAGRLPTGARTDRGGFLHDIDRFDAQFFEISPRESVYIDPQHRLLLEVAWEALEDAGQVRESYSGSPTGVYTGLWTNEYETRLYESGTPRDFYSVTGCGRASASGRLSFNFGLEGPSVTVDSACSSALVAVHMACQALWAGEIEMALAGGANLILGPEITELFTSAKMLSPNGQCKFGDASADGFVRSEGAGIVALKRLSRARADRDRVYAVIRGGAVNNDGRSSGLLVTPSREGQKQMIQSAWTAAGIAPGDIRFMEMHGTGTSVGDPVEIEAVGAALAEAGVTRSCALGSIKTNIGHTESAAGVAGLIKAALALHFRVVPPSLHFETPNPKIAWEKFPVHIAAKPFPLEMDGGPLLAGVSSFGITGTNAHVVLEAVETSSPKTSGSPQDGPYLLPVSARSPEALQAQLRNYRDWLAAPGAEPSITDICYTASARRNHLEHRVAIVGEDFSDLRAGLSAAIAHEDSSSVVFGRAGTAAGKVVFVAPGQGSQWLGMARELYAANEVFRHAFQQCDSAIAAETGWSLIDRVLGADAEQYLDQIDVIQPSLFAMSVALAAVWRGWGVEPDAVIGHSMGEVAAAHIAGILSLPDAAAVICRRSRLMKSVRGTGSMASVELSLAETEALLRGRSNVSIAASNGPHATVVAGETTAVEALLRHLEQEEIYCRIIKVDVASHSAQVDPILDDLFAALSGIQPQPGKIPLVSTVTGEGVDGTQMDAAYWVRNLRNSVLFAPTVKKLAAQGHDTWIELSPHPILLPAIEASAREVEPRALVVPSLRRDKPEQATLLSSVAALYAGGRTIDWSRFYSEDCQSVPLPRYPFQRERCWPDAPGTAARKGGQRNIAGLLGRRFESSLQPGTILWETELDLATQPWLGDHRVLGSAVFPAAGHVDMALSAVANIFPGERFALCQAAFESAVYLPEEGSKTLQIALTPEGDTAFRYEIRTSAEPGEDPWSLRSRGLLQRIGAEPLPTPISLAAMRQVFAEHRDSGDHYARTAGSGLQYGPAFQRVQEAWVGDRECLCRLTIGSEDTSGSVLHPALLDACFQAMVHVRPEKDGFHAGDTYLPVAIERVRIDRPIPAAGDVFVHAVLTGADPERGTFQTEIHVVDAAGEALVEISGMRLQRVARESSTQRIAEAVYTIHWVEDTDGSRSRQEAEAAPALASKARQEQWLVFADRGGIAEAMHASLAYLGGRCTLLRPGAAYQQISDTEFTLRPNEPADLTRVFDLVTRTSGVPTAIVHLWSLDALEENSIAPDSFIHAQATRTQHVPLVVQAVGAASWETPPRLWLVTAGATLPAADAESLRMENAPMWGIGRAVAREHAELRPALVDLSPSPRVEEARALALQVCIGDKEDTIALRGNKRYLERMVRMHAETPAPVPAPLAEGEEYRIEISSPGIFDNIELRAYPRTAPGAGEIGVQVHTAGLNFSDITKVMGLYPGLDPDQPIPVGNEAVGVVTAVGAGVTAFRPGDEVIVLTPTMRTVGTMASSVTVPVELAIKKPAGLTTEEAATIATVYVTAYWSLVEQARIQKGEWVLIHAGAGGVGLAAIEIARWAGANIIATVGSKEKEDYVRSRGVTHILNSRSLDFAQGVMDITAGRGVDVVLNSLAGEFLSRSLDVLASYGRFVEMGKRDIYSDRRIGLKAFRNNVSFHVVDVAAAVEDRRAYVAGLLRQIMQHIQAGDWRTLPVQTFPSSDPVAPFRFMAQARHIGKIAVRMDRDVSVLPVRNAPLFRADATYLVPGGLGGVGLTVAEWMAHNGAGRLVLLSRREPSAEAREAIRQMRQRSGAIVQAAKGDIADAAQVTALIESIRASGFPLKGIMHAAAVIDDALIANLSPNRFQSVLAPKIVGTWNLHDATLADDLDFFVLFSSIAALHPQPGMGSYAAANAFLDSFARFRRAMGKPAISINWGGWDQIGLARAEGTGRSIAGYEEQGMRNLSASEALSALELALRAAPVQAIAVPYDWSRFHRFHGPGNAPSLYAGMTVEANLAKSEARRAEILDALDSSAAGAPRLEILEAYLQETLGRVLKLASHKIDRERPLGSMGLDSLMGLEFVRRLSTALEIPVPATVVFNYPSVRLLAAHLLKRMHLDASPQQDSRQRPEPVSQRDETRSESMIGLSGDISEDEALQALIGNRIGSSG